MLMSLCYATLKTELKLLKLAFNLFIKQLKPRGGYIGKEGLNLIKSALTAAKKVKKVWTAGLPPELLKLNVGFNY